MTNFLWGLVGGFFLILLEILPRITYGYDIPEKTFNIALYRGLILIPMGGFVAYIAGFQIENMTPLIAAYMGLSAPVTLEKLSKIPNAKPNID